MTHSESHPDQQPAYIAGLFDAVGRVRFSISETDSGEYTVNPALRLYPYRTELRGNMIGSFLERQGYNYNFVTREYGRNFYRVQLASELEDLQSYLSGESAHLVRELEFVTGPFSEHFDPGILDPQAVYRFLKTRDKLRHGWRPRGINHRTPEDITDDHDIETSDIEIPELPTGDFRPGYSIKYLAGLFDGAARIRPSIAKADEDNLGYRMQPIIRLYKSGVSSTLINHVQQFCRDYNLRVGDSSEDHTFNLIFTGPGAIRRVLEVLYPQLLIAAEPAAILDDAVLPRFESDTHLTKQGFYDTLTILEYVAAMSGGETRNSDYTADYFADLWSDTVTANDLETVVQQSTSTSDDDPSGEETGPEESLESITLDPDSYSESEGRYQTVVNRHHRNQTQVADLKATYTDRCQVCGDRRARPDGTGYSEVHHIRPLGAPHDGPDTTDNMLVLCPNHHADFDNGVIAIDPETHSITHPYDRSVDGRTLLLNDSHTINSTHLTYHNEEILSHTERD